MIVELSESWQAVWVALRAYQAAKDQQTGRGLLDAIADHFRSGVVTRAEVCPMLGMLDGLVRVAVIKPWASRILLRVCIVLCHCHPQLRTRRGREFCGWNDFEMAGWTIAHDPYYTARIYKRLSTTRGMVQATCSWMVKSVREQEPDFDEQWRELLSAAMKGKP